MPRHDQQRGGNQHLMHGPNPHASHQRIIQRPHPQPKSSLLLWNKLMSYVRVSYLSVHAANNSANEPRTNDYRNVTPKMAVQNIPSPKKIRVNGRILNKGHYPFTFISMLKERSFGCRFTVNNLCVMMVLRPPPPPSTPSRSGRKKTENGEREGRKRKKRNLGGEKDDTPPSTLR